VVAYALAGTVDIDLEGEPIGVDTQGQAVYLKDLWPSVQEIQETITESVLPEMFAEQYADVFSGPPAWREIRVGEGEQYAWDPASTYIQEPPFFLSLSREPRAIQNIHAARALVVLGDSITTDHISPAGAIPANSPAGKYLVEHGVSVRDFNSYGARRGNDRVMTRGTFGNIRLKNRMLPGVEGGLTLHLPDGEQMSIYDAAMKYRQEGVPLVVLAGKEYGSGSSRDWAAKGTLLLGVKAVIAESYERIHRSNLIGMGVLPLQFMPGENVDSLGLTGQEIYHIEGLQEDLKPHCEVVVRAVRPDSKQIVFKAIVRLNTSVEIEYYRNGGILHTVLRNLL
jgi:aconitate hydratase